MLAISSIFCHNSNYGSIVGAREVSEDEFPSSDFKGSPVARGPVTRARHGVRVMPYSPPNTAYSSLMMTSVG